MLVDSCMLDFNNILNVILNRVYIKGAEQRGCPYVHRLYTKGFKKKKRHTKMHLGRTAFIKIYLTTTKVI